MTLLRGNDNLMKEINVDGYVFNRIYLHDYRCLNESIWLLYIVHVINTVPMSAVIVIRHLEPLLSPIESRSILLVSYLSCSSNGDPFIEVLNVLN